MIELLYSVSDYKASKDRVHKALNVAKDWDEVTLVIHGSQTNRGRYDVILARDYGVSPKAQIYLGYWNDGLKEEM